MVTLQKIFVSFFAALLICISSLSVFGETLEMRERERNAKGLASTATRGAPRWKKINEKSRNEIEKKRIARER